MITRAEMPRMRRGCVLARGAVPVTWEPLSSPGRPGPSLTTCAAFLLLATGCALRVRHGLVAELRRSREIAGATQQVLLRPLPGRMDGLALAAAQLSASRGAAVGGDLYEAVATAYGVRVLIGDVRGHGLPALGAAAAVLGSFREAAHDEPEPAGVLRRMERSLERHLRERARAEPPSVPPQRPRSPVAEEFVTVLLLQIAADGSVEALNCGHPWPYRFDPAPATAPPGPRAHTVRPLAGGETLPPLGVLPLPADLRSLPCGEIGPGEVLVLYTDGAEDARDRRGRFFPLRGVLARAPAPTPARLVAGVHAALLRHTRGRLTDDVTLLVLRNDRGDRGERP
ncbi:PP2C family protein-serine/threonine phosphatase [Streptomyces sp. NPDC004667]|uniref:PP2C family protein-serine/threonine phosphatase n=1 Tax=Streptomyces sp. NPDC004667 TaxID=3154285 RepID=UPI0033B0FC8B